MIKKVLIGFAVLIGLVLVAIIVVPHFIDWNPILKSTITTTAKEITGRDLTIEGDIGLTILPTPTFSAAKVRFANGPGGSVSDMATLESLDLRVALFPLLSGAIKVESVTLVGPKIVLETLPDGTPNWQIASSPAASGAATGGTAAGSAGGKSQAFQLDRLAIERGTLIYRDASGQAQMVEDLTATISAGSVKGPFLATGSAKVRGTPVKFDISTGALADNTPAPVGIAVLLADADAKLAFNGTASLTAAIPTVTGKLKAEGSDLGKLVTTLVPDMKGSLPPTLAQAFAVNGDIALDNPSASVRNIVLQLGDAKATGQLLVGVGPPLSADLTLALSRVDLDKLVGTPSAAAPSAAAPPPAATAPAGPGPAGGGFALPDNIEVKVALTADAITFRGGVIGNARLEAALAKGALDITRVSADLPGTSSFALAGRVTAADGVPSFAGTLKTKSDNLRGAMEWLKISLPPVPPDRLRKISLSAKLAATPASVQASDIDLRFDSTAVTGGVVISLPQAGQRSRPGYGVGLVIDQINLDGYVPQAKSQAGGATNAAGGGGGAQSSAGLPLDGLKPLADYDANVELRVGSLIANGQIAKGVHLEATLLNGTLTVKDASVKDFAGGRGAVSGTVSDLAGKPRFDTQIDLSASDGAKALQFAGVANPPAQIGALKAGGKLSGGGQDVSYDLTFSMAGIGAQGQAKGKATGIGAGVPRIDSAFQLAANDAGPLLTLAGLPAAAKLGAINVSGNAASGPDDLTYKIALALPGVGGKGTLDGKLTRLTATPQVDTTLDLRAEKPAPLLTMAGLTGDIVGKTGPLGVAGSLNGGIDKMALDLKLIGLGGTAAIKGNVAAGQSPPTFALDIAASHPDLRQLVAAVSGSPGPAGAFKLSTRATGSTQKASLANLSVEAGPSRVTGKVDYDASTSRPKINADLQAGTLDLAAFGAGGGGGGGGGAAAAAGSGGGTGGGRRWSRQRMDLSALDSFDGNVSLVADALIASGTRIDKAQVKVNLQAGKLTIARFAGGLYGGTVDASGELASRGTASLNANVKASNVPIEQLMQAGYLGTKFGGPVSVNASFAATGNSQAEWIESLNGKGSLNGSIKLLTRLDQQIGSAALDILGQKVKGVRGVTDVVNGAFSAFAGSSNTLSGDFVIQRGLLETNNISFTNNAARTLTHGTANLPPYTMNMATDVFRGGGNEPFITATLTGPIDGPNIKLGGAGFAGAAGALTSPEAVGGVLQQVAPGVANKLGGTGAGGTGGIGGVLQQVAPGLAGKAGGTAAPDATGTAPGATGTAPGAAGVAPDSTGGTPPAAANKATTPNKPATQTQPGATGAPGAAGTGQAQPAPAPNKKKKKDKLDQILPQILGN
jgi:uncharacterized protein involved in outer membrane biogenesis